MGNLMVEKSITSNSASLATARQDDGSRTLAVVCVIIVGALFFKALNHLLSILHSTDSRSSLDLRKKRSQWSGNAPANSRLAAGRVGRVGTSSREVQRLLEMYEAKAEVRDDQDIEIPFAEYAPTESVAAECNESKEIIESRARLKVLREVARVRGGRAVGILLEKEEKLLRSTGVVETARQDAAVLYSHWTSLKSRFVLGENNIRLQEARAYKVAMKAKKYASQLRAALKVERVRRQNAFLCLNRNIV